MHAQVCQNVRSQLHLLFHPPALTFFHAVARQQFRNGQGEFTFEEKIVFLCDEQAENLNLNWL